MSSINFQHSGWYVCEEMQSSLLFHHACAVQVIADFLFYFFDLKRVMINLCRVIHACVDGKQLNMQSQTEKENKLKRKIGGHATQRHTQHNTEPPSLTRHASPPAPVPAHALPSPELQWSQRVGCLGLATLKVTR